MSSSMVASGLHGAFVLFRKGAPFGGRMQLLPGSMTWLVSWMGLDFRPACPSVRHTVVSEALKLKQFW